MIATTHGDVAMLMHFHSHGLVPVVVEKWFRLVGARLGRHER